MGEQVPAITIVLEGRVAADNVASLEAFLVEARPFYESPGGIRMRFQWDRHDPCRFREIFDYATVPAYEADQQRVASDPEMRRWLDRWHALLDGPVTVSEWRNVPL